MRHESVRSATGVRRWLTAALIGAYSAGACAPAEAPPELITWEPEQRVAGAMAPGAVMVLVDGAVPAMQPAWKPVRWPDDSLACAGSFVSARGRADSMFAVWRTSAGRATQLRLARSPNGGVSWDSAVAVGRVEQDSRACRRPPPGVAVDPRTGTAFVAYFGATARGTGIVVVRVARDGRAAEPEMIAPGEAPAAAAVAASGDTLAVVYEAPVRPGGAIWLALTISGSQITRVRAPLSPPGVPSFLPAVALGDGRVGTAWNEGRQGSREPQAVARVGRISR